jgi:hypothetical protein
MVSAHDAASYLEELGPYWLGLGESALILIRPRESVEACEGRRVLGPEDSRADLRHLSENMLGFAVLSAGPYRGGQIVLDVERLRMFRPENSSLCLETLSPGALGSRRRRL